MTGILVVTHANLGDALIEAAEFILNDKIENISSVSIDIKENADSLHRKIKQGIKQVNTEGGVIIFTDMFGGTPSNLSYSFLKEGEVEVISGVNLPILLRALAVRDKMELVDAAATLVEQGKKSIALASDILKGSGRE